MSKHEIKYNDQHLIPLWLGIFMYIPCLLNRLFNQNYWINHYPYIILEAIGIVFIGYIIFKMHQNYDSIRYGNGDNLNMLFIVIIFSFSLFALIFNYFAIWNIPLRVSENSYEFFALLIFIHTLFKMIKNQELD
jgi:hypothetical protein